MTRFLSEQEHLIRETLKTLSCLKYSKANKDVSAIVKSLLFDASIDKDGIPRATGLQLVQEFLSSIQEVQPLIDYLASFLLLNLQEDPDLQPLVSQVSNRYSTLN